MNNKHLENDVMEDMTKSKIHFFDKQLAKKYGVDEAIMLNHLI